MRAWIYDRTIRPLTGGWYQEVLERIPARSKVLDVGIGTAGALLENAELVRNKALHITGVDIDPDYVKKATIAVAKRGLEDLIDVQFESIYDHRGGPYDAVYFAASFMLMPDPIGALSHVRGLLSRQGRVYFTQTFEERRSKIAEKAKPLLKKITTIDFGQVTYEDDFLDAVGEGGFEVLEFTTMGTQGKRSFRLAVARPRA